MQSSCTQSLCPHPAPTLVSDAGGNTFLLVSRRSLGHNGRVCENKMETEEPQRMTPNRPHASMPAYFQGSAEDKEFNGHIGSHYHVLDWVNTNILSVRGQIILGRFVAIDV